jgi:hypothetical protein
MDGSFAARSDVELVISLIRDESGEYPVQEPEPEPVESDDDEDLVIPTLSPDERQRMSLRDRLARLVLEEEFNYFLWRHGRDEMYLVGFETDPLRIGNRLGLGHRTELIVNRINRINQLEVLALKQDECLSTYLKGETMLEMLSEVRRDWIRGKVQKRSKERQSREKAGKPNQEDLLWKQIR